MTWATVGGNLVVIITLILVIAAPPKGHLMQCYKCGHDNRSGAKFCEECAARKLLRRTGNREQAQEHITKATAMYREMNMT